MGARLKVCEIRVAPAGGTAVPDSGCPQGRQEQAWI